MSRSRDLMASLAVMGFAAVALTGCGEAPRDALPVEPGLDRVAVRPEVPLAAPLVCAVAEENAVRAKIRPEGGTVSLHGHSIYFPPGAVREPVEVKLTVPASRYVEVDIQVNGQEHYRLARPVLAMLSYGRCGSAAVPGGPLTVWHVDDATRRPIERMSSLDDRGSRTVSFVTKHFSGFVIAN